MPESLPALLPVLSVIAGIIVLRAAGFVSGGITFDTWGAAFGALLISYFLGFGAMFLAAAMWPFPAMGPGAFFALTVGSQVVLNFVSLAVAGSLLSGMHVKGTAGLLLASILLTSTSIAMTYLPFLLAAAGSA